MSGQDKVSEKNSMIICLKGVNVLINSRTQFIRELRQKHDGILKGSVPWKLDVVPEARHYVC